MSLVPVPPNVNPLTGVMELLQRPTRSTTGGGGGPHDINGANHTGTPLTIANGGTGQTSQTPAFDALSPLTALGDVLYHDGSNNVRLAPNATGTNLFLRSVSSGNPSWAQVAYGDLSGSAPVTSVFARTGAVIAVTNDYTWAQIDKTVSDLADITTRAHSSLTGVGANDHHAQSHVLATGTALGPDHTISGAAAGEVLRALSATTAAFDVLGHSDLSGVGANDHHTQIHAIDGADHTGSLAHTSLSGVTADQHHTQSHVFATTAGLGSDHTTTGLTVGQVLRASSATTALFTQLAHSDLSGVGSNTHTQIDTHIADNTLHFLESAIDHANILNIGSNTHAQLDTHLAATSGIHGVTGNIVGTTDTQTLSAKTLTTPTIASFTNAEHSHQNAAGGGTLDHGLALTGLTDDDHTQYALLLGRSGGQTLIGGTASDNDLTLQSTAHATKGDIFLDDRVNFWTSIPNAATSGVAQITYQKVSVFDATYSVATAGLLNTDLTWFLSHEPTVTWAPTGTLPIVGYAVVSDTSAVTMTTAAFGTAAFQVFVGSAVFDGRVNNAYNGFNVATFGASNTYKITTANSSSNGKHITLFSTNVLETTNAGATMTWNALTAVKQAEKLKETSGSLTVTDLRGLWIVDPTTTGTPTVTRQIGVDVEDLTLPSSGNAMSLRSVGSDVQFRHVGGGVFGANSAPTNSSTGLEVSSTTKAFLLPRMTTTQRNALTAVNGMLIYNTTTNVVESYEGGTWVNT